MGDVSLNRKRKSSQTKEIRCYVYINGEKESQATTLMARAFETSKGKMTLH